MKETEMMTLAANTRIAAALSIIAFIINIISFRIINFS